ncbi:MAG TPA: alpha/beta fold hydrolase [Actinospica sp.]|jgi:cephalosporin-C deacetylase|nr:alpha/beta fold hydrolase [Actinospica sp.]
MLTDLDEAGLWEYRSTYQAPADFDEFWRRTLAEAAEIPLDVRIVPVETGLRTIDVYDVTFAGYAGHPIRAWLRVPRVTSLIGEDALPGVVQFHGYGSGRGHALDDLLWASAGYAHLLMDTRGQGGGHAGGDTGDPVGYAGPTQPGFLTRGLQSPETYYYRRVFVDAVRAVQVLREYEHVDASRVAVAGASQGGGIALAVAGLVPDNVAALHAQAPLLSDIQRATRITDAAPYHEISTYLAAHRTSAADVFGTLGYFDGLGFAARATAPAWFSAGLMDGICPPSTAFGAFHAYAGRAKNINLWTYNGHDAGGPEDLADVLTAFNTLLQKGLSS